jgi:hypothetical protein
VHSEHAIHIAKIDADAAMRRVDLTLHRSASPKRNDRHALGRAQPHDLLNLFSGLRKHHCVRRLIGDPGERVRMLLTHRLRRDQPIANECGKRPNDPPDRAAVALEFLPGFDQYHRGHLLGWRLKKTRPSYTLSSASGLHI